MLFLLLLLSFFPLAAQNVTSHSFFSVRPQFQSATPELVSLFYDRMTARCDECRHGAVQLVLFGSKSQQCDDGINPLAQYFMPFGKTALIAGEFGSEAVQNNTADLIANYFGVLTESPTAVVGPDQYDFTAGTYQARISINPQQTTFGLGFEYQQKLTESVDNNFWLSIAFPIMHIRNELNYCESVMNEGSGDVQDGFVSTIGDALRGDVVFNNKVFQYGKISTCPMEVTRVADIEFKIGRTSLHKRYAVFEGYGGIVIPTGNKPTGEFIFEPIAGNNRHPGFILGSTYSMEAFEKSWGTLWIEGSIDGRYLFSNIQHRSIDLVDKQWSRYVWLYEDADATPLEDIMPGINFLTQPVRVHPRFSFTINTAFVLSNEYWTGELGFNRYARQAEKLELCSFEEGPGIAGIDADDTTVLHTASSATMRKFLPSQGILFDTTPNFIAIKACDLDLGSAAHPAMITNTVYVTLGYRNDDIEFPFFLALGGSYEFSVENTGLDRWMVWCKGGLSF